MKLVYPPLSLSFRRLWPDGWNIVKAQNNYHVVVLVLLHHWYHQSGHDSPLDVQDVDGLVVLGVEFDLVLSIDCDLQWVPVGRFIFEPLFISTQSVYLVIQINSLGHGLFESLSSSRRTIHWVSLSIHIINLFQGALCCTEDEATRLRNLNLNLQSRWNTSQCAWSPFSRSLHA